MTLRETSLSSVAHVAAKASKPVVLILLVHYWPGHEATGTKQSIQSLAAALGSEFEFMIIGADGPSGSRSAEASRERWIHDGIAKARHCPVGLLGADGLGDILRATPHDILMLTGFFDRAFTIPALTMRRLGLIPRRPTILGPHGEFSAGALALKPMRKQTYLAATRRLGLLNDVCIQATGEQEADEIRAGCPWADRITIAPNIRVLGPLPQSAPRPDDGRLRIVFLSRIDRKKNLDYAIKIMNGVRAPVTFHIIGPVGDPVYWDECQELIRRLPRHIEVRALGAIRNADVPATLAEYDLFLLPTRGENFGHAIFDALEVGLPVMLSDLTPWQDLERIGAGWSLPLAQPDRFAAAIDRMAALEPAERNALRRAARSLAESSLQESDAVARNRAMLMDALSHAK